MDRGTFEKNLRTALATGKCMIGFKEAMASLKGSKLIIYSSALASEKEEVLKENAKNISVPVAKIDEKRRRLGAICGKHYPVSVVSIRSPGEADLKVLSEEIS